MLHVMKRQKLESTAPLPYTHQHMRSYHHQQQQQQQQQQSQQVYSTANAVVSSYASLQQQLHLQQQHRLAATPAAPATGQQGAVPPPTSLYGATTGTMLLQRPSHDALPKRRYDEFHAQQHYRLQTQRPQYTHVRTPQFCTPTSPETNVLTPLFPPTSSTSASPPGTVAATCARVESPQSLPGISAMLRRPTTAASATTSASQPASRVSSSSSAAPDASRQSLTRQSSTDSLTGSLVRSPMELQAPTGTGAAGFAPLATKWTPEMTSISPMKAIPAIALSATSSSTSSSMVYYNSRQLAPSAPSLVSATKMPAMCRPTGRRSSSNQSFDRKSALSLASSHGSGSSNNNSTSRSDASPFAPSLVAQHHPGTSSSNSMLRLQTAASASGDERIANPNKNSRYLREMDRREILSRIDAGEKQATLAKEYQVSRAAICNLNKHREEVMLRKDENPLAKHPKKPRPKAFKIKTRASKSSKKVPSPRTLVGGSAASGSAMSNPSKNNLHEVKSRAAALLLTSVRNKNTSEREFARSSERLLRLLLEDALALVPIKPIEVFLSDCVRADGVGWEHPPCAISLEQAPGVSCPLLQMFRSMEPEQPTARATVTVAPDNNNSTNAQVDLADASQLPSSLQYHNVFVLALSVTASADAVCAVITTLLARGAVESMLSLVVLFISSDVIQSVRSKFPSVKIVAAQVDPSGKTPPRALATSAAVAAESGEARADASDEHSASASPPCCLDVVLDRFRQVRV